MVQNGQILTMGHDVSSTTLGPVEVVDLDGAFLMPAFGDGHAHPVFGALEIQGPAVRGSSSVEEIVTAVAQYARDHPREEWIVGGSYDPTLAPDGVFDAAWLDQAVPDRPVVLRAHDYHTVWCNSEALRLGGITTGMPDPPLGRIVRRSDGTPCGTLREWHACALVLDLVPDRSAVNLQQAVIEAHRTCAAAGLTWVLDAWVDVGNGMTDAYLEVAASGAALVRFDLALRADPDRWPDQHEAFRSERNRVATAGVGDLVMANTVKFFADGIVESGTAALLEPYVDCPHSRGMMVWEPDKLAKAVADVDAAGFHVHIHAIGDAAVRAALDAVEYSRRHNPPWARRPVISHVQLVHPQDIPRFVTNQVIANFEPYWAQYDNFQTRLTLPRIGERGAFQYPMASMVRAGAQLSFGSDWPISSLLPLDGIQVAVARRTPGGTPAGGWIPEERLEVHQALEIYTAGAARQASADLQRGTITPGAVADLICLSDNPFTVPLGRLATINVVGTWKAGRLTAGY